MSETSETNELGPAARKLLDDTRHADDPGTADALRVRAALFAKVGIVAGAGAASSTLAAPAKATSIAAGGALGGVSSLKLGIVVAVAFAAAWLGARVWENRPSSPGAASTSVSSVAVASTATTSSTTAPTVASSAPSSLTALSAPTATVAPSLPSSVDPPKGVPMVVPTFASATASAELPGPAPSATGSASIAEEIALLRSAQQHLAAGDVSAALLELDEHAKKFPEGAMSEERDGARLVAHCMRGDPGAVPRAEQFLATHGGTPIAVRVRSACGLP